MHNGINFPSADLESIPSNSAKDTLLTNFKSQDQPNTTGSPMYREDEIALFVLAVKLSLFTAASMCASKRGIYRSKEGDQRKIFLQSANNFIITRPRETIIDKNIGECLSTSYFKSATVGNTIKGFKNCGTEIHNPLVFNEHGFAASKAIDHDVVGDETENNSANPQTLVVENQHINHPEETELIANADYDAPKKAVSVFFIISNQCL
ncbi:uncharacterized protein TNCV_4850281 [Trichonephila clavipes]|nr:uncharacterized protein TNCV_4850281 [Trichonephila clavipes]